MLFRSWNDLRARGKGVSLGEYGVKTHPAWTEENGAVGYHIVRTEEEQKQLFWKILDIWVEELPSVGLFGDFPLLVVVKNGFKGIHDGYGWDCCTTVYEYVIDDATWYWDEPEKHTM